MVKLLQEEDLTKIMNRFKQLKLQSSEQKQETKQKEQKQEKKQSAKSPRLLKIETIMNEIQPNLMKLPSVVSCGITPKLKISVELSEQCSSYLNDWKTIEEKYSSLIEEDLMDLHSTIYNGGLDKLCLFSQETESELASSLSMPIVKGNYQQMDNIEANLTIAKDLLQQVLQPSVSAPYLSTEEIAENDKKISNALHIILQIIEHVKEKI